MSVFKNTIPEAPQGIVTYCITFNSDNSYYNLYFDEKTVTVGENEDTLSATFGYYQCKSGAESWEYVSSGGMGASASYPVCNSDSVSLLYSSYDISTDTGGLYFYSGYNRNEVMNDSLSSSVILTSLKNSVLPVVSVVGAVVFLYFGFRKAWSFFTGLVKGA